MTDSYCFLHLEGPGNGIDDARALLEETVAGPWAERGIVPWGAFRGLFGVASNELLVMAASARTGSLDDFTGALGDRLTLRQAELFLPTLRPERIEARTRPGIYVFRFFRTMPEHVEEFVSLSGDAWVTFEGAEGYAAEPQGLFRQSAVGADGSLDMLLVTWYSDLKAWQTSRRPDPEAARRFARRHELTQRTVALATALLTD